MKNLTMSVSHTLGALALATLSAAPLAAQGTKVQLAFGYECDNKFALRNEGAQGVTVEYAVSGTSERGKVSLKGNETVELESASNNDVQLYVDGKMVATEKKGNKSCAAAQSNTVTVRHLDPSEVVYAQTVQPVVVGPDVVYVRPYDYYYPYPYYSSFSVGIGFPFYGGYGRTVIMRGGGWGHRR